MKTKKTCKKSPSCACNIPPSQPKQNPLFQFHRALEFCRDIETGKSPVFCLAGHEDFLNLLIYAISTFIPDPKARDWPSPHLNQFELMGVTILRATQPTGLMFAHCLPVPTPKP